MKKFGPEISFVFTNKCEPCKLQNDLRNMRHLQSHSFDLSRPGSFIWFSTKNSLVQKTNENLIIFPEVLKSKKFKICNTVLVYIIIKHSLFLVLNSDHKVWPHSEPHYVDLSSEFSRKKHQCGKLRQNPIGSRINSKHKRNSAVITLI